MIRQEIGCVVVDQSTPIIRLEAAYKRDQRLVGILRRPHASRILQSLAFGGYQKSPRNSRDLNKYENKI